MRHLIIIFLVVIVTLEGKTQRDYTHIGDYIFKSKNDFDTGIVATPKYWTFPGNKLELSMRQVVISMNAKFFGFNTPYGNISSTVIEYKKVKTGHSFTVRLLPPSSCEGQVGTVYFMTNEIGEWEWLAYLLPCNWNGSFKLAERK